MYSRLSATSCASQILSNKLFGKAQLLLSPAATTA
jgi:hypothetical protein